MNTNKRDIDYSTFPDFRIWCLLVRTWFSVYRLRQIELSRLGLTVEQSAVLNILRHNEGWVTIKDLENITARKHNSISVLIQRMMKAGLVYKEKRPGEKSSRIVQTPRGKNLFEKITTNTIEMVMSVFSQKEKKQLYTCLQSLHNKTLDLMGISNLPPFIKPVKYSSVQEIIEAGGNKSEVFDFDLWSALDATGFTVNRLRAAELVQYGITVEQSAIINSIAQGEGWITVRGLEHITLRRHNSISVLVNRMVKSGLLVKEKRPGEKSYRIYLTARGEELYNKVTTASIDMVFSCFSADEKTELARYLHLIYSKARALLNTYPSETAPVEAR
jgi:DNA-binding MarR family transcriptional regulator